MIQFVADPQAELKMPPEGERLPPAEIDLLTRWVREGAIWPDGIDNAQVDDGREHWSFQPIRSADVPHTNSSWPRHAIDQFILHRMQQSGLNPSPETDRRTWLRRVTLDLTGLPPTPDQVDAFLADEQPDAYEHQVEELLQSPRYGEHWAQHWLDVVRYADTHGFEVNTERPHAWPYRDYVIQAFNDDTPYDQFIREQIAGDACGQDAATGFLITASVLLPGQIGADEPSRRLARQDALDEIVMNIGQTFLGLSLGCARCHDHKFDPVTQRDYYAMQAFVAGVEYLDRELHTAAAIAARENITRLKRRAVEIDRQLASFVPLARSGASRPMVSARLNVDRIPPTEASQVRLTILATNSLEPCLDEIEIYDATGRNLALSTSGATVTASGSKTSADRHELRFVNDGEYGNSRSWMSDTPGSGWVIIQLPESHEITQVVWGRDRLGKYVDRLATNYTIEVAGVDGTWHAVADSQDRPPWDPEASPAGEVATDTLTDTEAAEAKALEREKSAIPAQITAAESELLVFAGVFRKPDQIRLLTRGDPEQPREDMAPAVPVALGNLALPGDCMEQDRRLALANWISSSENPLSPRVMVNRVWQGHFGTGLVETPSDFGRSGLLPSHPELLDWLSARFIESGWSVKQLHRWIVLSATYRQSSRKRPDTDELDADVRLLWRYPTRRLESEMIRDSMLAVSGRLNLQMYGPGYDLFDKRGGLTGFVPVESYSVSGLRRMIYSHKVRREREAVFGAFDCPDAGQSTARRRESMTPLQALNLFNSRFTLEESAALAERVQEEVGGDLHRQIRKVWKLALSREPQAQELAQAESVVSQHGLPVLCRVLFNCNEFLFVP